MNGELMDKYRNRNDTKKIKLFDDNHILGIHFAVSSLQLGEEAWFRVQPKYHYYDDEQAENRMQIDGSQLVGSDEPIFYKIKLLEFTEPKEHMEFRDFDDYMDFFKLRKNEGNELFQQKQYDRALKKYTKVINKWEGFPKIIKSEMIDEQKLEMKEIISIVHGNIAQCYMNLYNINEALVNINKSLSLNPKNAKNLYRKAVCYQKQGNFKQAIDLYLEAQELNPDDKLIDDAIQNCLDKQLNQDNKDKKLFKKVFERMEDEEIMEIKQKKILKKQEKMEEKIQKKQDSMQKQQQQHIQFTKDNEPSMNNINELINKDDEEFHNKEEQLDNDDDQFQIDFKQLEQGMTLDEKTQQYLQKLIMFDGAQMESNEYDDTWANDTWES